MEKQSPEIDLDRLAMIERVNVIGTSGSGKSTFARALAQSLRLPYVEMDQLFWKPNWTKPTDVEFLAKIDAATANSHWVLDGNYSRTTPIKWRNVQLIIWLDLSFLRTLFRVTRRSVMRSLNQSDIWPETGNRETLRKTFLSPESVVLWTITSYRRNRLRYAQLFAADASRHIWLVRLRSPAEAVNFLNAARVTGERVRHAGAGSKVG